METKNIPNFKGYAINVNGVVYNSKGEMKTYKDRRGYSAVYLYDGHNNRKYMSIHRLVMLTFNPISNSSEMTVNHKDGNKNNNHISNLEWLTNKENMQHAFRTGLKINIGMPKGTFWASDKTRLLQAMDYRKKYGTSFRKLQSMFGINRATLNYQFNNNFK